MRIRTFCKYLDQEELRDHTLKDCTVVVDGQNFFYNLYQKSGLPSVYGCESDKYADFLRKFLGIFKKSKIRCVFIFKGGHLDINYKFRRLEDRSWISNWSEEHYFAQPVFMKELYKQILDEIGMEYAICEYEAKAEVIAFAKKYKCPIVSYDIEFCFSGVPYIPYSTINECEGQGVKCGLFNLQNFMKKYNLNNDKLAIFIALTDENIFEENYFIHLFESLNMPNSLYKRNICLLKWLGRLPLQRALNTINNYVERDLFNEKILEAKKYLIRTESTGTPTKYIEDNKNMDVTELDPNWFEKGVTMGRIPINYVNLYRNNIYFGAWTIEDVNADDSLLLSLDIIKYAFNLLTNFEKKEFTFCDKNNKKHVISSIITAFGVTKKPEYNANNSPFENGWDQAKKLDLFEYFLQESLQDLNHAALQRCPEDMRLLMIALVYFSRRKTIDTTDIVCGVLLSYVMLGVVFVKIPNNIEYDIEITKKPLHDTSTKKESVNEKDCVIANRILESYFKMNQRESQTIFSEKLIHPFVEFQHCLVQINNLNDLCGCTYKPTKYNMTFNGTFIYKLMFEATSDLEAGVLRLIKNRLNPAATVLSFFNGIFEAYQEMMYN
ncbi:uncharacterized protein LOC128672444 isoform X2 [Plodia interpunctella]|nr:uncharacterized protein LOC128672444 isoform X2 [Plodia interpunctella]